MGTLDRYQKSGGFLQLLQLIETCGPQKQEKFLSMVKEEDPRWSEAIQKKLLTMDKIMTWSDEVISEIAGSLQELTLAIAFHGLRPEDRQRFYRTFSFSQRRKIDDLFETNKPSPADISAAYIKILVEVRKLMHEGALRADKVDPEVFVPDGIEDALRKGADMSSAKPVLAAVASPAAEKHVLESPKQAGSGGADPEELRTIRKKLIVLSEENNSLKQDIQNLNAKIEQILNSSPGEYTDLIKNFWSDKWKEVETNRFSFGSKKGI